MRQMWFVWLAVLLIAAPTLYADGEGPPRHRGEGARGPREDGEGGPRAHGKIVRGKLVELGKTGCAVRVGDDVVELRYPPRMPDPLERFLKAHKGKQVALRAVRREHGWMLLGPAHGEGGPRRREGEGEGPPRGPRDGEGPPRGPREDVGPGPRGPRADDDHRPPRHRERPNPMREHQRAMRAHMQKVEQAERQVRELAEKIRNTDDTEKRGPMMDKMRKMLSQLFEMREAPKRKQLDILQAEVERLRRILKLRAENKDKIVQRRLRELIGPRGDDDVLHW